MLMMLRSMMMPCEIFLAIISFTMMIMINIIMQWITTAWMREGVTADNNWGMNDPSGVRIIGS